MAVVAGERAGVALENASAILGEPLGPVLTRRSMQMGAEAVVIDLRAEQAEEALQGLLKSVYSLLFAWIVEQCVIAPSQTHALHPNTLQPPPFARPQPRSFLRPYPGSIRVLALSSARAANGLPLPSASGCLTYLDSKTFAQIASSSCVSTTPMRRSTSSSWPPHSRRRKQP